MTVREALALGQRQLAEAGIEFAQADVEWLLAHVTGHSRTQLILRRTDALSASDEVRFTGLLAQRAQRIPLQHLVGTADFLSHTFTVSPAVLTPRPETEQLALHFIERLKRLNLPKARVLDWGTGSGCLAISIAAALPEASVTALDQSTGALEVAQRNAENILGLGRVQFFQGNGFNALPPGTPPFDGLISNPPYIPADEILSLQPEVRDFDPHSALDGGVDGLEFYRAIAAEGVNFMVPGALAAFEFGDGQASAVREIFEAKNWCVECVEKDLSERDRVLIVHAPSARGMAESP